MKKTKIFQKCFIGILFIVAGGIYLGTSIAKATISNPDSYDQAVVKGETSNLDELELTQEMIKLPVQTGMNESKAMALTQVKDESLIKVYVCGCVNVPDVYELNEDARVIDAIKAADGFTNDAAKESVNQAQLLNDGQRIYIPSKKEIENGLIAEEATDSDSKADSKVNLNLATKEELMTLPGIGETKAEHILAYRKEHGGFQTIEDIMQIAGVKQAVFSKVKDLITVR